MIDAGYYIIEYNYKDKLGHIRTKREMRGTFDLILEVHKKLTKMIKNKDPKAPIIKPRFLQVTAKDGEMEIDFKEELEKWQNMKLSTKK